MAVIRNYFPDVTEEGIRFHSAELKCGEDDIVDSICLAIVANLMLQKKTETIPAETGDR